MIGMKNDVEELILLSLGGTTTPIKPLKTSLSIVSNRTFAEALTSLATRKVIKVDLSSGNIVISEDMLNVVSYLRRTNFVKKVSKAISKGGSNEDAIKALSGLEGLKWNKKSLNTLELLSDCLRNVYEKDLTDEIIRLDLRYSINKKKGGETE